MAWQHLVHGFFFLLPLFAIQTQAASRGSFSNPAASSRPFFRYWLPDASVDPDLIAEDVANAGKVGAGGVEFVPFYNYGGEMGGYPEGADWSKYGFGTPAFQSIFRRALEAHRDNDMVMDFAIGPNQGQGVPAKPHDKGLQWDLVPFAEPVPSKKTTIDLPGWGEGELIAAITALVTDKTNKTSMPPHLQLTIREGSLQVVTAKVNKQGKLPVAAEELPTSQERWVFAFYQRRTLAKNVVFPARSANTIFDNGSFTVDHFSARGAQTVIDFWEKHILLDGVDELLSQVGNYGWEDSLEIQSNISWTPRLPKRFKAQHGYDVFAYLPLIMWANNNINIQNEIPGTIRAILDSETEGSGYIGDYRATLQKCYQEYIGTLSEWTNRRLGRLMSVQVSYNMPMDAAASVPYVDVPECESLQWRDNIDGYRQFSGAAALAGQRVVSNEMGGEFLNAFKHTIPGLLASINRAFAGGVNRVVIHGQTYAHNYYNTTWPGYTAWQYVVSEPYSDKFPSWERGLNEALEYAARTQHVLQSGRAVVDIALYNKVSASDPNFNSFRDSSDLLDAGYSYRYLTPHNFDLSKARVENGQLGPDSASFKALVVTSEHNKMTLDGAKRLVQFAQSGLPIVFEGNPKYYAAGNGSSHDLAHAMGLLFASPHVYRCGIGKSTAALARIGITPRVATKLNSTVHTTWRSNYQEGINYLFLFADKHSSSGYIEVKSGAFAYTFDAWSGLIRPLLHYSTSKDRGVLRIPINLEAGQTIIFGFSKKQLKGIDMPKFSITELPSTVLGSEFSGRGGLVLHVPYQPPSQPPQSVALSTGRSQVVKTSSGGVRPPFDLKAWTLRAEHWGAPRDITDANVLAVKRNTTHKLHGPLSGWTKDPKLANVSGIGYYETSFEWTGDRKRHGAYLNLPRVLHAIQVVINGQKTLPVDCYKPVVDIGPFLHTGENIVTLVVPTTMWNYLRSLGSEILSSGAPPLVVYGTHGPPRVLPAPEASENGLVGPVFVMPYERVVVNTV
ncbi:hypothetical protein EDB81DRAFT_430901 [Dactylonectria macrodidyma]|uniref:Secreted protein n=1 Tax=Dactylonectria macrodidyma TaxID=307937 RepID=A0A9P9CXS3_9HYPO|nr:hypothetical protein EDB81DRAFT_430901 [Dactylonectria macrodidyma]